jgi:hypothetical protein
VEQLDEAACAELGLVVVDGTLEQLTEAGAGTGRLSFEDRVCLILARDNGWTCVSNDGRLRRECEAAGDRSGQPEDAGRGDRRLQEASAGSPVEQLSAVFLSPATPSQRPGPRP